MNMRNGEMPIETRAGYHDIPTKLVKMEEHPALEKCCGHLKFSLPSMA